MTILKNDMTITSEEVAMNVAHIEGKVKELHSVMANLATLGSEENSGSVVQAMDAFVDESNTAESRIVMKVMKRVMGRND